MNDDLYHNPPAAAPIPTEPASDNDQLEIPPWLRKMQKIGAVILLVIFIFLLVLFYRRFLFLPQL